MTFAKRNGKQLRNAELAQIHIARTQLGLDDDTYRAIIFTISPGRTRSSSDLDWTGRKQLLEHFKAKGWKPSAPRKAKAAKPEKFAGLPDAEQSDPAFGPDGALYFLSNRKGGKSAVWRVGMAGGTPTQVTGDYDLSGFKLSPTGDRIVVWADRPVGATNLDTEPAAKPKGEGSGRTYDQLFVRHWDAWSDGQRSQLFVLPLAGGRAVGAGKAIEGGLVGEGALPTSHATDDGVGLVYEGTELVEAVADRPGVAAYVVERQADGTVTETRIEPRLLG